MPSSAFASRDNSCGCGDGGAADEEDDEEDETAPAPAPHEDEERAAPPTENVLAPESRADAAAPTREKGGVEMRRVGDTAWRCFKSQKDAANAFGLSQGDVSRLISKNDKVAALATRFEARKASGRPTTEPADAPTYDLAVGDRIAFGGRTGVVAALPVNTWWKVRLNGEERLRSARRCELLALDEDGEVKTPDTIAQAPPPRSPPKEAPAAAAATTEASAPKPSPTKPPAIKPVMSGGRKKSNKKKKGKKGKSKK